MSVRNATLNWIDFITSNFRISTLLNWKSQLHMPTDTRTNLRRSNTFGKLCTVFHWNQRKNCWNSQRDRIVYQSEGWVVWSLWLHEMVAPIAIDCPLVTPAIMFYYYQITKAEKNWKNVYWKPSPIAKDLEWFETNI